MHKTHKDIIRLPPFQYLNQNTASSEAEMLQGWYFFVPYLLNYINKQRINLYQNKVEKMIQCLKTYQDSQKNKTACDTE